jgi:hypothetical protein
MDNMKNIKELRLETIQLEDQVLLVESTVGGGKLNDWVKLSISKIEKVEEWNEDLVGFCNKIIASTKPLEGLPLLMIEDEDEAKKLWNKFWMSDVIFYNSDIGKAFKGGFEKAKETFKFTEEDLKIALSEAFKASQEGYQITSDEIIQSLTKKELWVEIENYCGSPYTTERCPKCIDSCDRAYQRPKITDGKIKAIWK